jgi:hypothetical protein
MAKATDIPWTKREIGTIVVVFVCSMVPAAYMPLVKS